MARKRANLTDLLNDLTFRAIYDKYRMIALNEFEWDGLPDGIESRFIERYLFEDGKAIFFKGRGIGYNALRTDPGYGLNVHSDPLTWLAIGNGYREEYAAEDCVIIRNNISMLPTHDFIMFYANKLTEIERTMDVNVKANKTPFFVSCDDKTVLSFKQIFAQIDGNVPAIFADKSLTPDSLQVMQTGVKFLCNELQTYKSSVESDLMTFLGVDNVNFEKRERLITDEAQSNNQLIASFRELQLSARQDACEQINQRFGLNVSVRTRSAAEGGAANVRDNDPQPGNG